MLARLPTAGGIPELRVPALHHGRDKAGGQRRTIWSARRGGRGLGSSSALARGSARSRPDSLNRPDRIGSARPSGHGLEGGSVQGGIRIRSDSLELPDQRDRLLRRKGHEVDHRRRVGVDIVEVIHDGRHTRTNDRIDRLRTAEDARTEQREGEDVGTALLCLMKQENYGHPSRGLSRTPFNWTLFWQLTTKVQKAWNPGKKRG